MRNWKNVCKKIVLGCAVSAICISSGTMVFAQEPTSAKETVSKEWADVDGNGTVELSDAQLVLKSVLKIAGLPKSNTYEYNGLEDAQKILKMALKIIDEAEHGTGCLSEPVDMSDLVIDVLKQYDTEFPEVELTDNDFFLAFRINDEIGMSEEEKNEVIACFNERGKTIYFLDYKNAFTQMETQGLMEGSWPGDWYYIPKGVLVSIYDMEEKNDGVYVDGGFVKGPLHGSGYIGHFYLEDGTWVLEEEEPRAIWIS